MPQLNTASSKSLWTYKSWKIIKNYQKLLRRSVTSAANISINVLINIIEMKFVSEFTFKDSKCSRFQKIMNFG